MRKILLLSSTLLILAGCGGSGSLGSIPGSFPSFGRSAPAEPARPVAVVVEDPSRLLAVRRAETETALRGVIIRVESVAPAQGFYAPELRVLNEGHPDAAGVITYEARAVPGPEDAPVGPEQTRVITSGAFLTTRIASTLSAVRIVGEGSSVTLPLR